MFHNMRPIREGESHPLENPVILEEIFENLSMSELRICREVCKAWRQNSSKAMRKAYIIFDHDYDENGRRLSDIQEIIQSENFPEFHFSHNFLLNVNSEIYPGFWTSVGHHIRVLELSGATFQTIESFQQAIFESCPNLETFIMKNCAVLGYAIPNMADWEPPRFPQNWNLKVWEFYSDIMQFNMSLTDLFYLAPALEKLDLIGAGFDYRELFQSLGKIRRQYPSYCKLTNLSLCFIHQPQEMLEVLVDGHLQLVELNIDGLYRTSYETSLWPIITGHSASLKKLCIQGSSPRPHQGHEEMNVFTVPDNLVLKNVTSCRLSGNLFDSMEFLRIVPNVKEMFLHDISLHYMIGNTKSEIMGDLVLSCCTKLKIFNLDEPMTCEDLERVGGWFPNLIQIRIDELKNETFETLCRIWPNLKVLKMEKSQVDDAGVSGLDIEDVEKINKVGETGMLERPSTVPRASISSLKNLQRFRLQGGISLKYCALVFGIQELTELKQLKLEWGEKSTDKELWQPLLNRFCWK